MERYRKAGRGDTPGELFTAMQGDFIFRMPANKVLESQVAGGGRAWAYSFAWKSPVVGKSGAKLGAAHSCDVPFVFKTTEASKKNLGDTPPAGSCRGHALGLGKLCEERQSRMDAL